MDKNFDIYFDEFYKKYPQVIEDRNIETIRKVCYIFYLQGEVGGSISFANKAKDLLKEI